MLTVIQTLSTHNGNGINIISVNGSITTQTPHNQFKHFTKHPPCRREGPLICSQLFVLASYWQNDLFSQELTLQFILSLQII